MDKTQNIYTKGQSNNVFYNTDSSNVFTKQPKLSFIYRKSEKLAKAIYLITENMSEVSLKEDLRDSSREILSAILAQNQGDTSRHIIFVMSGLSIARSIGCISHMNASLVENEYRTLLSLLEESEIELDLDMREEGVARRSSKQKVLSAPGIALKEGVQKMEGKTMEKGNSPQEARTQKEGGGGGKEERRAALLRIIASKGQVSIKDIKDILRDLGEKTIQRELNALYERGEIDRKGSKRWTVYISKR